MVVDGRRLQTTRAFAAGRFGFTVAVSDESDAALIESLLRDLPVPSGAGHITNVFVLVRLVTDGDTRWVLTDPRLNEQTHESVTAVIAHLLGAINLGALDADPERLHLHAAAAVKDGRAVVIAAARNTGKSTTVAHLVERGWEFVTDETVCLDPSKNHVSGFAKPLSIKPGGQGLVEHLTPWMVPTIEDDREDFRFVPVGATGASVAAGGLAHLVIMLRRPTIPDPGGEATSRPLHPADATVALMQETLDAERFGPTAERLAHLAASSRCYEVTVGTPAETANRIDELLQLEPLQPLVVSVLPPSAATGASVISVRVGDRTVVHDEESGRIFALDAAATRIWEHLGGWRTDPSIDLAGPVVAAFVGQLQVLGVLGELISDTQVD